MSINLLVEPKDLDVPGNPDELLTTINASPDATPVEPAPTAVQPVTPDLPEKYKGKSVEDLVSMHQNLESLYGRMANDLGTQRSLTDQLLELKRHQDLQDNTPPAQLEITSGELLDDPTGTLNKFLEAKSAEMSQTLDNRLAGMEQKLTKADFLTRHSDYNQIAQGGEFAQWIQGTPYRSRLAQVAAKGDYAAADDLLTEYKASVTTAEPNPQPATPDVNDPLNQAKQAILESGNSVSESVDATPGKTISRATLMQLRLTNPAAYQDPAFQAKIVKAYAEGRVK